MRETVQIWENHQFEWVEVVEPSSDDITFLHQRFGISAIALQDCLLPIHLPQYVQGKEGSELLLRAYDVHSSRGDSVQDLTRKIVMFWSEGYFVTVSRVVHPLMQEIRDQALLDLQNHQSAREIREELLLRICSKVLTSFAPAFQSVEEKLDTHEANSHDLKTRNSNLKKMYSVKRKATVLRRTIWRTIDTLQSARNAISSHNQPFWSHLCEQGQRLHYHAEELEQGMSNAINLQLAISNLSIAEASQKTNDVMRTLTLFSAVFLPLSLVAGIYGMNFKNMPELEHPFGYFGTLLGMAILALGIIIWFFSRGYIRKPKAKLSSKP
jgi:magnesium transporter